MQVWKSLHQPLQTYLHKRITFPCAILHVLIPGFFNLFTRNCIDFIQPNIPPREARRDNLVADNPDGGLRRGERIDADAMNEA